MEYVQEWKARVSCITDWFNMGNVLEIKTVPIKELGEERSRGGVAGITKETSMWHTLFCC